jgi:sugar transferase (PEP-CTERM/EpsH1 system associated)
MNILYLTSRLPFPPIGGDRVRSFHFIKHLSRRHRVTIAALVENRKEVDASAPYRNLYHHLIPVPLSRSRSYLNCLRGLGSGRPLQVHYYESSRMRAVLAREIARESYDVVVCHMIRMAPYLDDIPLRKVVDFCDALSLFHERSSRVKHGSMLSQWIHAIEAKRVGPFEIEEIAKADVSLFISPVDVEYLRRRGLVERIAIVPNGVDVTEFAFNPDQGDDNCIVYMGNMHTFQNTDAATWLVESILPLIQSARPDAVLYIVGNAPSRRVRSLHDGRNVIVTGRVRSVATYVARAAVVVAPMRAVAGVQNKILESLALGRPVVTTSIGAEGLERDVLTVADAPSDFARAVVDLMENPRRRAELAIEGRRYVEAKYQWETSLQELDSILAGPTAG